MHRAFFSEAFPRSEVQKFERMLPAYESMIWPLGQMLPFANIGNILRNILGWREDVSKTRLLVMAGREDKLMDVPMMRRLAALYRGGISRIFPEVFPTENKSSKVSDVTSGTTGVDLVVVEGSGHHLQNDLHWQDAASQFLNFLDQL